VVVVGRDDGCSCVRVRASLNVWVVLMSFLWFIILFLLDCFEYFSKLGRFFVMCPHAESLPSRCTLTLDHTESLVIHHSTCNNRSEQCSAMGPGKDMFESTAIIGQRQVDVANKLFDTATENDLGAGVDFVHA
jgi:hypothetical protein